MEQKTKDLTKKVLKTTGLASIVALETPIHETMHAVAAKLTFGNCYGIVLSPGHWYSKPLELLSFGFYKAQETQGGADGYTMTAHANTFLGNLGSLITAATPEFVYTTIGMAFVKKGVEEWKERPLSGMFKTLLGGMCMSSTLNYMKISFFGAQPGHDYYNVTQNALQMVHLPEGLAAILTPVVGVPALFAAAYFTAGFLTDRKQ
ncbi:hypothetical protein HZA97_09200 [Candidatus Woesearchaeota archaeon]|nr:hypothetical protein [Candidatus Woesearchaeota archaeon]